MTTQTKTQTKATEATTQTKAKATATTQTKAKATTQTKATATTQTKAKATEATEVTAYIPEKGKPYSGIRRQGAFKRGYTLAALARAGYLTMTEGKPLGYTKTGRPGDLEALMGPTAFRYWSKTKGYIDGATLTSEGRNHVAGSLTGGAALFTARSVIHATLKAFETGAFSYEGHSEKWNANVTLSK